MFSSHRLSIFTALAVCSMASICAAQATELDAGYFTGYSLDYPGQVSFVTCGSSKVSEGCYGSGRLGPFGRVGCVIEGVATTTGHVVTRAVYVVDVAAGANGDGVILHRYLKTDTIDPATSNDTVSSKLTLNVPLPLVGGAKAACHIAGTSNFLYIGTDQTAGVVRVTKGVFTVFSVIDNSFGGTIKAITSDVYGYVSVQTTNSAPNSDQFILFDPRGNGVESGGGDYRLLTPYSSISNTTSSP